MWIDQIPVISTGHVKLAELDDIPSSLDSLVYRYPEGVLIGLASACTDEYLVFPPTICTALDWALDNGFTWLRIDADGDLVDGLPEYDHA